ncbi:winged helix-turn-helix domain-containing protein [Vibrio coralliilyticus]|uniref:winged helix-turn-helix domain-containing protein n=1 Tax=Vibrio coralliilyticus TaxID=190893 RepID=UPI0017B28472|nr:helix-turn-helix domain-containing protein [Vibrio coralliilyticus]NUW69490.1 winged helix-turn-helix domain-containing protein [Vibrio coralliilyticus]
MIVINKLFELDVEKGIIINLETKFSGYIGTNETQLLTYFLERPNVTIPKKELLDHVWTSRGVVVEESSLMNAISNCRKLLSDKSGEIIKTKRGAGYCFSGEVEYVESSPEQDVQDGNKNEDISSASIIQSYVVRTIKQDLTYDLLLFILLFISSLFVVSEFINKRANALESADRYLTGTYTTCNIFEQGVLKKSYKFPRIYTYNGISILIDESANSISYPENLGGIDCE